MITKPDEVAVLLTVLTYFSVPILTAIFGDGSIEVGYHVVTTKMSLSWPGQGSRWQVGQVWTNREGGNLSLQLLSKLTLLTVGDWGCSQQHGDMWQGDLAGGQQIFTWIPFSNSPRSCQRRWSLLTLGVRLSRWEIWRKRWTSSLTPFNSYGLLLEFCKHLWSVFS